MGAAWSSPDSEDDTLASAPGALVSPPTPKIVESEPQPPAQTPSDTPQRRCPVCAMPGTQRCSRCKEAYYCGQPHATRDWPHHKKACGGTQNTPKRDTVDAILFPVDSDMPRIVKIEYTMEVEEDTGVAWMRLHNRHLFVPSGMIRSRTVRAGDHDFIIRFSDDFLVDGSPINRCVRHLLCGRKCRHPWGNIFLAVRADPQVGLCYDPHYRSAHISDVTKVVDEFVIWDRAIQKFQNKHAY